MFSTILITITTQQVLGEGNVLIDTILKKKKKKIYGKQSKTSIFYDTFLVKCFRRAGFIHWKYSIELAAYATDGSNAARKVNTVLEITSINAI